MAEAAAGHTGAFVVLEGGDGAGKSTQVRLLADWLTEQGHEVVLTHEPGDTPLGQEIRRLVLDGDRDVDLRAEALLLLADKAQHLAEVVRPALARGAVVVCDRYVDSMIAYQGAGGGLPVDDLEVLAHWATGGLVPDVTVLLDVDPEVAVHRKASKDRMEGRGVAFHDRVRQAFRDLAEADAARHLVLPARRTREEIAAAIRERVSAVLSERPGTLEP